MTNEPTTARLSLTEEEQEASARRREALHRGVTELAAELDALERATEPDRDRFAAAVQRLIETLEQHVEEVEAPGGLLSQIIEVAPWFGPRVEGLREEHELLLDGSRALLDRIAASEGLVPVLGEARVLVTQVDDHRHRGTALLVDAYMLDIPQGD